ncbi:MAG: sugar transferase [Desulfomonilaceae bacterium]
MAKRAFDIIVSLIGLIIASPLMCAIALLIKLESRGPIFYSCVRAGKGNSLFGMLKFRTMVDNADNIDCKLCGSDDVRVTRLGSFLRRTKLNELPQLFNVLIGQMSMVGPRPEDPKFLKYYPEQWQIVLSVQPGIAGPNQILNRNEEDAFVASEDPERLYVEQILPDKLDRDIDYVRSHSLFGDFMVLATAAYHTLFKGFTFHDLLSRRRTIQLIFYDTVLSLLAYAAANWVRFETLPLQPYIINNFAIIVLANPFVFFTMGVYKTNIRFFSVPDFIQLLRAVSVAGIVLVGMSYFLMFGSGHSRAVFAAYPVFLAIAMTGARLVARLLRERKELQTTNNGDKVRVLIYGAGRLGTETLRRVYFQSAVEIVGFVDDNEELKGQTVLGAKILGSGRDLEFLKSLYDIKQVIIAFHSSNGGTAEAGRRCLMAGLRYVLARSTEWDLSAQLRKPYHSVSKFIDTLAISPTPLDKQNISNFINGSSIAIVGAGDALGEALCAELVKIGTGKIILIEDCETRLVRIDSFVNSLERTGMTFLPYFLPLGSPTDWIKEALVPHDVKWVIYNRPNRPGGQKPFNANRALEWYLRDALLFLELAGAYECNRFSFVSPFGKDSFSVEEKTFLLLLEKFLRASAGTIPNSLRTAIIRLPNILENDCEIFATACNRISQGNTVQAHRLPLSFASAQNAARTLLNSLPAHNNGETYFVKPNLGMSLPSLIEEFFKYQGDGDEAAALIEPMKDEELQLILQNSACAETCTSTVWPELSMVVNDKIEDVNLLNRELTDLIGCRIIGRESVNRMLRTGSSLPIWIPRE